MKNKKIQELERDMKISPSKIYGICFKCEVSGICDRINYTEFLECNIVKE